jgi:hypothetical protein
MHFSHTDFHSGTTPILLGTETRQGSFHLAASRITIFFAGGKPDK